MTERAPGPFYSDPAGWVRDRRTGRTVCTLHAHLDPAECEETLDLLNKGTHFDGMREALEDMTTGVESAAAVFGATDHPGIQASVNNARAVLAKAGGRNGNGNV